jgi:hypothetical protein
VIVLATIGALALYLLLLWLASAIVAGYISERKGYGEKAGLASGLLLSAIGPLAWVFVPAKAGSNWRVIGPFPWQRQGGDAPTP